MKNQKRLCVFIICMFASCLLFAQPVVTKSTATVVTGTVCPGENISYTVSVPDGFGSCAINWTATNGTRVSQSGASAVIKWNDTPGATGTVTATFSACSKANEGNNGISASLAELILSVKDQAWGFYGNQVSVDFCTTPLVYLSVAPMYVAGTGQIGGPPQTEVKYVWTLPAGWKDQVSNATGDVTTNVNYINIVPTGCALPGLVKVQGAIKDRCGSSAASSIATITINGVSPTVTIGPQPGYQGGTTCNTTPVTFYVSTSPSLGCINNYTWSYPPSWHFVSSTFNSITLQPSGNASDQNPINATAHFTCGTTKTSGNYIPPFIDPAMTGPSMICDPVTFSITNAQGVPVTWSSSNSSILSINSSGVASRTGSNKGGVTISASFGCGGATLTKEVWVGEPIISFISGPSTVCPDPNAWFSYYAAVAGNPTVYQWNIPGETIALNNILDYMQVVISFDSDPVSVGPGTRYIELTTYNECGATSMQYAIDLPYYCFSNFAISPNPASTSAEVSITVDESKMGALSGVPLIGTRQIHLYDKLGTPLSSIETSDKNTSVPTHNLPDGIYIIEVRDGKKATRKLLTVKH